MANSDAGHLQAAGWPLTVYNRTKAKADALIAKGAQWADTPRAVAEASDVVFTIRLPPRRGRSNSGRKWRTARPQAAGGIVCDMSTSSPMLAERIAAAAKKQGCEPLDAPVTGGDVGARDAKLSIFVGGDEAAYNRVLPCFNKMGTNILQHCGGAGFGQKGKLANQAAIAGVMISTCESFSFCAGSWP